MYLKVSSVKCWPFYLGLYMLMFTNDKEYKYIIYVED